MILTIIYNRVCIFEIKSENQTSSQRLLLAVALADAEAKPAVARLDTRANIILVAAALGDTLANTLSIFLGS